MKPYERRCVVCGQPESAVGVLSRRGVCEQCGHMIVEANIDQMREKRGPFYEHWARRLIMSGHRALVASREVEP
jgi:hypothetical protein